MNYWKSERPQGLIRAAAVAIFLALAASTLVVPNLPYRAAHSDIPLDKTGRVCGQCGRLIEQDILDCPHCSKLAQE